MAYIVKYLKHRAQCPNTKFPSLDMILRHLDLLHISTICLRNIHFHFILACTFGLWGLLFKMFLLQIYALLGSPILAYQTVFIYIMAVK
jgi:hypothetical protein